MFPTAGYFRNAPCPFFIHGLCHRPYCHFRHAKQDTKGRRDASADWTYGETLDDDDGQEASKSNKKDDLMKIIKNLTPAKRNHGNLPAKKSALHVQFELDHSAKKTEVDDLSIYTPSAVKVEPKNDDDLKGKAKNDEVLYGLIPHTVVKDISDLLEITRATDESTKIAEEVKKIKRVKKGSNDQKSKETADQEIKSENSEKAEEKNIFDTIEALPRKPPKLKDVNFFEIEKQDTLSNRKKKKGSKRYKDKQHDENSGDSSSDAFDNSEATLKEIFDSYDPIQSCVVDDSIDLDAFSSEEECPPPNTEDCSTDVVKETVGVGSIKKRIAHNPSIEAKRQPLSKKGLTVRGSVKPSFVSPSITSVKSQPNRPKPTNAAAEKVNQRNSFTTPDGIYIGKKRKAHAIEPRTDTPEAKVKVTSSVSATITVDVLPARPQIPIEFGSRVPQLIRQRYLDKIVDEYMPKIQSLQEVYDKATEDEKQIFNRCSSRQIYVSLCVNAVKRIRGLPNFENDSAMKHSAIKKEVIKPLQGSYAKVASQLVGSINPSKTLIRPSSVSLAKTDKKHSSLLGDGKEKGNKQSLISNVSDMTEDVFYEHLQKYLTTDEDRWDNNYPKQSPDKAGFAVYRERKGSENLTKQNCARCGTPFQLNSDGEYITRTECHYHWGKLRRMRDRGGIVTQFSCCQVDTGGLGCSIAKLHVADYRGDLDGYVITRAHTKTNTRKIYSLDCEMCYTSHGLELTRVTVVDFNLSQVLDAFVKPDREIIDYNTRFSGVTEEDLQDVEIKLKDVHRKLLKKFGTDTILIGHSLESDLRALKLIHNRVVDTALVFPHRLGLPYKRALKTLMGEFLQKIIQENETGHDSYEDAAACMQLMKWKVFQDLKKESTKTGSSVR